MIRRLVRRFVAPRTTVLLLCLLAALLLLNVALPSPGVLGPERFERMVADHAVLRLLLVDLGLSELSTSPLFLGLLGLFFLNLLAVLVSRTGPTWRRIAVRPRSERGLKAWARMEESLTAPLPAGFGPKVAARVLRGFGYRVRRVGETTFWAVKHRTAPLGFLLFHVSFFLLCAGGLSIHYTRFVGRAELIEGQTFEGDYSAVLREAPFGGRPELAFDVVRVEPRFERGEPVHLRADLRMRQVGGSVIRSSRVNHPARWGGTRILVERAGLAPVLWLQDRHGFTVDRLAVPAPPPGEGPAEVALGEAAARVRVHPLGRDVSFPSREELPAARLRLQVQQRDELVFDERLGAGEAVDLPAGRLVLEEMRYWIGVRVIAERGGGFLIAGFTLGILGLAWRLLAYRRELALDWDAEGLRLVGRSEYFSWRFREELRSVRDALRAPEEDRTRATEPARADREEGGSDE